MDFNSEVVVVGMKRSKGDFEGTVYNSTKFYIETNLDDRSGNAWGKATAEYSLGDFDLADKYKHIGFPFRGKAVFSQVTTGKAVKLILVDLVPIAAAKAAA